MSRQLPRGCKMKFRMTILLAVSILIAGALVYVGNTTPAGAEAHSVKGSAGTVASAELAELQWQTVVNNSFTIPGGTKVFSSYSQPSVNTDGVVVFRGRSTGGKRETGIFLRKAATGKVLDVATLATEVPYPNNLNAKFLEFSAIPRIAENVENVAFLGLHKPVYRFTLPDGSETRAGTAGIYARLNSELVITGASKLAIAPDFGYYGVPGYKALPFDIFPGAPAITDDGVIVFKGNYQVDGVGKTGIFFRRLLDTPGGGPEFHGMVANTDMEIPGMPPSAKYQQLTFSSTAPPSVSGHELVFLGLDNEDSPGAGGIYHAFIKDGAPLNEVVMIGKPLPNIDVSVPPLTRIGEGLSFDGRHVAFWGAWGNETRTLRLYCPEDGNPEILAYCNGVDPESQYDEDSDRWYQERQIPINQGIFLYSFAEDKVYLVAENQAGFADFLFWVYSGKVPGEGPDIDAEPPRWRSSAFVAVSGGNVVFKARSGFLAKDNTYVDPMDGLYLKDSLSGKPMEVVAELGMDGAMFDAALTPGTMPVTGLGIERDGFRGRKLAITLTMANEEAGWGGIYLTTVGGGPTLLPAVKAAAPVRDKGTQMDRRH